MNGFNVVQVLLDVGLIGAILLLARDQGVITERLEAVEAGNVREDKAEHDLHDESTQLRSELDEIHAGLKMLAKAERDRDPLTDWRDDHPRSETLEGAFAPPYQRGDTHVFSPNAPKLPRFDLTGERHATMIDQLRTCPACDYLNSPCPRHQ